MILRAGLTGGIASGKSTAARTFAALGCLTVDADAIVSRLYQPGAAGHAALVRQYGLEILLSDGEVDRARLATLAFADEASASQLNALIHPLVLAEEERILAGEQDRFPDRDRIFVVEATLLLEAGGRQRYDRVVVVDASVEDQIERAIIRGMPREEVLRRVRHQMSREERVRLADYVIDNSGDPRARVLDTQGVFEKLLADLQSKKNHTLALWKPL